MQAALCAVQAISFPAMLSTQSHKVDVHVVSYQSDSSYHSAFRFHAPRFHSALFIPHFLEAANPPPTESERKRAQPEQAGAASAPTGSMFSALGRVRQSSRPYFVFAISLSSPCARQPKTAVRADAAYLSGGLAPVATGVWQSQSIQCGSPGGPVGLVIVVICR